MLIRNINKQLRSTLKIQTIIFVRMTQTERSMIMPPHSDKGCLTPRTSSITSRKNRKGISLSKQLEAKHRSKSPAFIKIMQKGSKKPLIVERREIKLLLKVKDSTPSIKETFEKENRNRLNMGANRGHMDSISTKGPVLKMSNKLVNENFPLKKTSRKERTGHQPRTPLIHLF